MANVRDLIKMTSEEVDAFLREPGQSMGVKNDRLFVNMQALFSQALDRGDGLVTDCSQGRDARARRLTIDMSLGTFDYGFWNWLVLHSPPTTGERIIPRWVFEAIPPEKLDGFTIEYIIGGIVAEHRLPVTARVMDGVTHRTKRDKFGPLQGTLETVRM